MFLKISDDVNGCYDTELPWAIYAKNYFINHNGFSLSQTIFGKSTNLPNIMNELYQQKEK